MEFIGELIAEIILYYPINGAGAFVRYVFSRRGKSFGEFWRDTPNNTIPAFLLVLFIVGVAVGLRYIFY